MRESQKNHMIPVLFSCLTLINQWNLFVKDNSTYYNYVLWNLFVKDNSIICTVEPLCTGRLYTIRTVERLCKGQLYIHTYCGTSLLRTTLYYTMGGLWAPGTVEPLCKAQLSIYIVEPPCKGDSS